VRKLRGARENVGCKAIKAIADSVQNNTDMKEEKPFEGTVFKLSNGEKINSSDLEKLISDTCHYIKYAVVGKDEKPVAFIFPKEKLLQNPDYKLTPEEGCFCPRSLEELGKCLTGCLKLVNKKLDPGSAKINTAALINPEQLSVSGSPADLKNSIEKYRALLKENYKSLVPYEDEIYIIKIE